MKTHKPALTLAALTASFVSASVTAAPIAPGTVIGVDFGQVAPTNDFNGAAVTSSAAGSIAAGNVIDTTGVVIDGVSFTYASTGTNLFNNSDADEAQAGQPSVFNVSNLTDWWGTGDGAGPDTKTLTFLGLDDSLTYDLVVGAAFNNDIADVLWSVDGQSATTDGSVAGSSYITFTGLSTDGFGKLEITGTGTSPRNDIPLVAALALTAVPEPGSLALLGLGGLMIARRRRG